MPRRNSAGASQVPRRGMASASPAARRRGDTSPPARGRRGPRHGLGQGRPRRDSLRVRGDRQSRPPAQPGRGRSDHGSGCRVFEAIRFENGKILNPRFSRYPGPRFGDVPQIDVVLAIARTCPRPAVERPPSSPSPRPPPTPSIAPRETGCGRCRWCRKEWSRVNQVFQFCVRGSWNTPLDFYSSEGFLARIAAHEGFASREAGIEIGVPSRWIRTVPGPGSTGF